MHTKYKPSKTFFKYLRKEYAYSVYGYHSSLSDAVIADLLSAAYGITAWIFTKSGVRWIFLTYGIEELVPHFAFNYWYTAQDNKKHRLDQANLSIFCSDAPRRNDILKETISIAKKVIYAEGWRVPDETLINRTLRAYRDWLQTTAGKEWARDALSPIFNIHRHGGIAYKFKKSSGGVYWTGGNKVEVVANEYKGCDGCDLHFPCIEDHTGLGALCNRCYAENFADTETLGACCRFECKAEDCGHHLTHTKLRSMTEEVRNLPIQWESHG